MQTASSHVCEAKDFLRSILSLTCCRSPFPFVGSLLGDSEQVTSVLSTGGLRRLGECGQATMPLKLMTVALPAFSDWPWVPAL